MARRLAGKVARGVLRGLASTVLVVGVIFLALILLQTRVINEGPGTPVLVLFLAVLFCAWIGGFGAGLAATAVILLVTSASEYPLWRQLRLGMFLAAGTLISAVLGSLRSARRKARVHVETLDAVLGTSEDHIYVLDERGRYVRVSDGGARVLGLSPGDLIGKTWRDLGLPAEIMVPFDAARDEVIATNRPSRGEVPFEGPLGRQHFEYIMSPVQGGGRGRDKSVVVVSRDITDRKRAEDALRASEERFRLTADGAPVLIWIAGADGGCTWLNRPWLQFVGRTMAQELGSGWTENIHSDDLGRCMQVYFEHLEARRPFTMEYRLRRHDGAFRWVIDHGLPLDGPDGAFAGYIGSCVDIHDLKDAEAGLKEADRRKDEFLAMLAHELRNPLAAIGNAIEFARRSPGEEHDAWSRDVAARQVKHLSRLIDDLLDVSRITRGKIRLRRAPLDLRAILSAAAESVRPFVEEREHRLSVALDPGPLPVEGDATRLEQVAVNLLVNAAKYTEAGGRIWLSASREGDSAVVRVRDTGIGIPPDKLPGMFELFVQGDRSLARSEGGLGIGLTLVRRLVEMHGGAVSATSAGPGQGSEFAISLPMGSLPAAEAEAPTPPPRSGSCDPRERTRRILVVDDNPDTARGMSRLLRLRGNDVRMAHDGPSAIEEASGFGPDFVLLDIGLPGMDGYQVAERLRREPGGDRPVIVAISGYGQDEDRRRSRESGIDHHLVKPVDHDALLALLDGVGAAS